MGLLGILGLFGLFVLGGFVGAGIVYVAVVNAIIKNFWR